MMIKTKEDVEIIREAGKRLARILRLVGEAAQPGVSTRTLNGLAEKLIREGGDTPAFLRYTPGGAPRPYPATLCVSINDEVVHGIPNESEKILREGDIVGLDCGLVHKERIADACITVPVGELDEAGEKLIRVAKEALLAGIAAARAGNHVGDIGVAVEKVVRPHGYGIPYELGGHGVGYKVHEEPHISFHGKAGKGPVLKPGMVLAIEPMIIEGGTDEILVDDDGYTIRSADGSRSAQFEHTVLVTDGEPEVLTKE